MRIYNRREGIPKEIDVREGFYELHYSSHAKQRFQERAGQNVIFPHLLNIIRSKNVLEVKTEDDNTIGVEILVRIPYRKYTNLFLVVVPFDNNTALVKTLWFREKNYKSNVKKDNINHTPGNSVSSFSSPEEERSI